MIPKLIVIKKLDQLLENDFHDYGFIRANKKRKIEVIKKSNDLVWGFTYIYYDGFDLQTNQICGRIEPFVSIYHEELSNIYQKILGYEDDGKHIYFLMTAKVSGIIQYSSGETKGVYSPQSSIKLYDTGDDPIKRDDNIQRIAKETIQLFEKYALPFYSRFNSLESILPELGRDITYLSLYSPGVPSRILMYLIALKLLGRPNVRDIAEGYKKYFESNDILSDHKKGYKNLCENYL